MSGQIGLVPGSMLLADDLLSQVTIAKLRFLASYCHDRHRINSRFAMVNASWRLWSPAWRFAILPCASCWISLMRRRSARHPMSLSSRSILQIRWSRNESSISSPCVKKKELARVQLCCMFLCLHCPRVHWFSPRLCIVNIVVMPSVRLSGNSSLAVLVNQQTRASRTRNLCDPCTVGHFWQYISSVCNSF